MLRLGLSIQLMVQQILCTGKRRIKYCIIIIHFLSRIPLIGICVGLAIKKQLRAGIVYNPITRELFSAQIGKGAFKNGFPIRVSKTEGIS